jgi:hypothetical protein
MARETTEENPCVLGKKKKKKKKKDIVGQKKSCFLPLTFLKVASKNRSIYL